MGSSLTQYRNQVEQVISQVGILCEIKRKQGGDGEGEPSAGVDGYGKPTSTHSSPNSISELETKDTVSAIRFWPSSAGRTERQRTQYGYVDADSPMIAISATENVRADDYIFYENSVYQLGNPVEYPTHYEFDTVLYMEDFE